MNQKQETKEKQQNEYSQQNVEKENLEEEELRIDNLKENQSEKVKGLDEIDEQINQEIQELDDNSNEAQNDEFSKMNHLNEIIVKNKRRTREESTQDRNYTCGCGKSYLSYPALYLHLKNKHNGKPPSGTLLPSNQFKKKKNQNIEKHDNTEDSVCLEDFVKFLKNLDSNYVNEFKRDIHDEKQIKELIDNYFLMEEGDENMRNNFIEFLEDKYLLKQVRTIKPTDNSLEINQSSINNVFAYFLAHLSRMVSYKIFQEFSFFFEAFRHVINKEGYKYCEIQNEEQKVDDFCSLNSCEPILEMANVFISQHLLNILSKYEYGKFMLFGPTLIQIKYVIHVIQIFSNWLYNNRFTNSKLIISNDNDVGN